MSLFFTSSRLCSQCAVGTRSICSLMWPFLVSIKSRLSMTSDWNCPMLLASRTTRLPRFSLCVIKVRVNRLGLRTTATLTEICYLDIERPSRQRL